MADVRKTHAQLTALLADNSSGDISPQDIRDMLESLVPAFGSFSLSAAVETSIATVSTPVKCAGTTTAHTTPRDFTHTNGRLTYTGPTDQHLHVASTISFMTAGSNKVISFYLAKNGSVIAGSKTSRKIGTGSDVGSIALHWDLMVSENDYVEIWVENETDNTNLTASTLYLFALGMLT